MVAAAGAVDADKTGSSKLIWFYRHGQSRANVVSKAAREADGLDMSSADYPGPAVREYIVNTSLEDAALTEEGIRQAIATATDNRELSAQFPSAFGVEVIVCSPMTRAIQTAATIFEEQLLSGQCTLVSPDG